MKIINVFDIREKKQFREITNNANNIKERILKKAGLLVLIMSACTALSRGFFHIETLESNIVMIYLLGIIFISYIAEGYIYSLFSSISGVLLYNFFFTEPYYTFKVNNPDYLVTFFVMFIVGLITSMLTIRIKLERQHVEDRERYISSLYHIEKKLLNVKSDEELARISSQEISRQLNADVLVQFYNSASALRCQYIWGKDVFHGDVDQLACIEALQSGSQCGHGTMLFSDAKAFYKPILNTNSVMGIIAIALHQQVVLTDAQQAFINVIIPQISVVMEREEISKEQQRIHIEMQKERLRSDMLRSISHDFRTPLAAIMGLASTALDNYDKITDDIRKNFLQSIYDDADWLNELVENILQTTRFEDGKVTLKISEEAAEEIIMDAVTHVKKHANSHNISVKIPDEILIIQVDGILIRQVLVNILNNAINYTQEDSDIVVALYRDDDRAVFEVKDNGPGILKNELANVFNRYYHSASNNGVSQRGMGLGLALCKSIIEAHNGKIEIMNNDPHGTIVRLYIWMEKE